MDTIDRLAEFNWIKTYIKLSWMNTKEELGHLRVLWTAYCIHHGLEPDTSGYDNDLLTIWEYANDTSSILETWLNSYDKFDNYMCEYMV